MDTGMLTVYREGENPVALPVEDRSVLELLIDAGFHDIIAPCGGNGLCGNCKVRILGGNASGLHPDEERQLSVQEIDEGIRLACRVRPLASHDLSIVVLGSEMQGQVATAFAPDTRRGGTHKQVSGERYGCAIDIGTTTVVVYLVRLDTHQILDHRSAMNRQRMFGADVISRIQYAAEHDDGLHMLQRTVVAQLDAMIGDLLAAHQVDETKLDDIVAVGNPTMIHLLVAEDPGGIAAAPYVPSFWDERHIAASRLGFKHTNTARMTLPGLVAAYVGSDITSGVAATLSMQADKAVLYVDIGTNGEIVLWDGHALFACSSAAGPAFEGASIRQGLGAIPGAIDRVSHADDGTVRISTIGGAEAKGICGSGIIDAMALLLDTGVVDETGAMDDAHPLFGQLGCDSPDGPALRLTGQVSFTNRDVREVQLAKAAIAAGAQVLLHAAKLSYRELSEVVIAGGFGSYIDIASAQRIGLLPPLERQKIHAVGNAAGKGALQVLMLSDAQQEVERIRRKMHYIELSTSPEFQEYYIEHMLFEGDIT